MNPPARTLEQRTKDTRYRLEHDTDAWVATADAAGGSPYLVPLSFLWEGATLLVATPLSSPTGRNLRAGGRVRIGIGLTRDVVLVEGDVHEIVAGADIPGDVGDALAAKTGFDPREFSFYAYFRIQPQRIQAWREVNELSGRDLMREGRWFNAI